ncbi:MAG: VOC family protein [Bacteroidota bacterium]
MQPKMIWANLAISDITKTTKFYTVLGFTPNGNPNAELTSFSFGKGGFVINFFLKDNLEFNWKAKIADAKNVTEIIFTLSAESISQVDTYEKEVQQAGGKIISSPAAFGKGYYGFDFADPDGHRFNVFYMEGL